LVTAAIQWRLGGLLDGAVAASWPPGPARDALHALHLRSIRDNTQRLQAAADAVAVLDRVGLRALPLKGAAVAEALYASVGQRPMADVDLLALDDWAASVAALDRAGYAVRDRADHAWCFEDPGGRGGVELHIGLTSCPRLHPFDADGLWSRSRTQPGAQVTRVPAPEDLLVQGGLHAAFQHGLAVSPVQYLDLRRLLERGVDPDRCADLAAAGGAERALWCALTVAGAVAGAGFPDALRRRLERWVPARLRRWVEARAEDLEGTVADVDPPLAWLRWELAAGRHGVLVRDTLCPAVPGQARPGIGQTLRRALSLALRTRRIARP
jgi:hypothetical protein